MDLADRLRWAREQAGLSGRGLDEAAGLNAGHSWALENRKRESPELETVSKLASALGVSLDWLANGEGKTPTKKQIIDAVARATRGAA